MNLKPIPETLGVRWGHGMDDAPVGFWVPWTPSSGLQTYGLLLENERKLEVDTHVDRKITRTPHMIWAQDQTGDPVAMRQQG